MRKPILLLSLVLVSTSAGATPADIVYLKSIVKKPPIKGMACSPGNSRTTCTTEKAEKRWDRVRLTWIDAKSYALEVSYPTLKFTEVAPVVVPAKAGYQRIKGGPFNDHYIKLGLGDSWIIRSPAYYRVVSDK